MIRTLLLASFVLCWTTELKLQTDDKPNGSTVRGIVVYSDTGRPLRHARVTLFGADSQSQNTASDLRGQFEFERVPEGKYRLIVEAPGLLTPYRNVARVRTIAPEPVYPDIGELITDFTVTGTDSVDLKIKAVRGGVITGKVVNEDDQPVQHAEIRLLRRESGKWVPPWRTWAQPDEEPQKADATGVYRIAGLPAGEYLVRASEGIFTADHVPGEEDTYTNGSFVVTYHPAATRIKNAQLVSVVAGGETTGVDIRLKQQVLHTLTGTVKFELLARPGSSVQVMIERSDEAGFSSAINNHTTNTNDEGKWQVSGLPSGEYLVTINGSAVVISARDVRFDRSLPKRLTVKLQDEKVTTLNTTLTLGAQVVGKVTFNNRLPVPDSLVTGVTPVEDPTVPNRATDQAEKPSSEIGLVYSNGAFSISPLLAGTYWFTFSSSKQDEFYVKSVTRKGIDLMQSPFKLTDDLVFDDVVVTLATDLAVVEGQLTMPGSEVTVIVAPANEATRRFNPGTRILEAGPKGQVIFRSAPGEYLIAAVTTADYKAIASQLHNEYFEKNPDKFLRIKLRAGEKIKDLRVPMMKK
jgi:hypothetical protein